MFPMKVRLNSQNSNQGRVQAAPSGRKPCVSQPLPMPEMLITFPHESQANSQTSKQGGVQAAPSGRKPCVSQPLPMPEMRITFSMNCRLRSVYSCANHRHAIRLGLGFWD